MAHDEPMPVQGDDTPPASSGSGSPYGSESEAWLDEWVIMGPEIFFDPIIYGPPPRPPRPPDLPAPVTPQHLIRPSGTGAVLALSESIERGFMLVEDLRLLEQMAEAYERDRMRAEDYPDWYLESIMD